MTLPSQARISESESVATSKQLRSRVIRGALCISELAKRSLVRTSPLAIVLHDQPSFLTLGSVSSDTPYMTQLSTEDDTWANIFHYHNTGGLVENGVHTLKAMRGEHDENWNARLAWLCGFLSHVIADATIHPIVEAAVGPVADHSTNDAHMYCEMVQDVLIMKDVLNVEVIHAEYTNDLLDCIAQPESTAVLSYWSELANMNAPFLGKPDPDLWLASYRRLLDSAEGGGVIGKIMRHVGSTYFYQESANIGPDLRQTCYENIALPDGNSGPFRQHGFDKAVEKDVAAWLLIEKRLFHAEHTDPIAYNWNLDTGIDQATGSLTYWS